MEVEFLGLWAFVSHTLLTARSLPMVDTLHPFEARKGFVSVHQFLVPILKLHSSTKVAFFCVPSVLGKQAFRAGQNAKKGTIWVPFLLVARRGFEPLLPG